MAPAEMNSVVMHTPGDPEVLQTTRTPVPRPGEGEVLVRVHAVAISSQDLLIRAGKIPVALPSVPGSEAAGEVILVGPGVTEWSRGDRVVSAGSSLGQTGACADYLIVSSIDLHPIPDNVSFVGAVSIVGTFASAWSALFHDGQLAMKERVVVVGAADPLGIAAVQICRWKECRVIAVADGRHAPRLAALGTTRVVSQSAPDLAGHVIAGLDTDPATFVLNVTGALLPDSLRMLGRNGRLIVTNGRDSQSLDLQLLVSQQTRVIGSSASVDAVDVHHILKLVSEGTFIPVIDSIFVFTQAAQAHRHAESPDTFGAVLLVPDQLHESAEKITKFDEEG